MVFPSSEISSQMGDRGYPTRVTASASAGIATSPPYSCVPQVYNSVGLKLNSLAYANLHRRRTLSPCSSIGSSLAKRKHIAGRQFTLLLGPHRQHRASTLASTSIIWDPTEILLLTRRTVDTTLLLTAKEKPGPSSQSFDAGMES